jgi:hypothetical protein
MYGVGPVNQYRTPEFWKALKRHSDSEGVKKYFENNGVDFEVDPYGEPVPVCRPFIKKGNQRISIFSASRDFINKVGRYDEQYLRACEYQYFFQAVKRGIPEPTSEASYTYLGHYGGLFRTGVGAYHPDDWKYHPSNPFKVDNPDRHLGKKYMPEFRYKRGKHNVFRKKDNLELRYFEGRYEVFNAETGKTIISSKDPAEAVEYLESV